MRATAKPIAAYQIWINFISNPQVQLSPSHRGEQSAATLNPNTRKVNEPKVLYDCTKVMRNRCRQIKKKPSLFCSYRPKTNTDEAFQVLERPFKAKAGLTSGAIANRISG
jgi:hypothetical protein